MSILGYIFGRKKQPEAAEPQIGSPIGRGGLYTGHHAWRDYLDGVLEGLKPPAILTTPQIEAMRRHPTLADCERFRRAILLDTEFRFVCKESDEVQRFGTMVLERWRKDLLLRGSLSMRYGNSAAQIVWQRRPIEVQVIEPDGVRLSELPTAFWPKQLRWLDVREDCLTILQDELGDFAGVVWRGQELARNRSILFTHQDDFGYGLLGETAYLAAWTPWQAHKRALSDYVLFMGQKGNPPGKAFAPDPVEWAQLLGRDVQPGSPEDPTTWVGTQAINLQGGGVIVLPSRHRRQEAGTDAPDKMFDLEYLQVPNRADEFDKALAALRLLMIESFFCGIAEGQASAKQTTRNLFIKLRPDAEEWAEQVYRGLVRKAIVLNFGEDAPHGEIVPGMVAENRRELLVDFLKQFSSARQRLSDGREFEASMLVDVEASMRAVGIPTHDVDQVATEPKEAPVVVTTEDETSPGGVNGRPRIGPGSKDFDSDEPEEEQR